MPSLVVEGERDLRCRPTKCACTNPSRRTDLRDQRSGSLVVKSGSSEIRVGEPSGGQDHP